MKKNLLKAITILSIFICLLVVGYTDVSEDILHQQATEPVMTSEVKEAEPVKAEPVKIKVKDAEGSDIFGTDERSVRHHGRSRHG